MFCYIEQKSLSASLYFSDTLYKIGEKTVKITQFRRFPSRKSCNYLDL